MYSLQKQQLDGLNQKNTLFKIYLTIYLVILTPTYSSFIKFLIDI